MSGAAAQTPEPYQKKFKVCYRLDAFGFELSAGVQAREVYTKVVE